MRTKLTIIPDALSPDNSLCEHCKEPITWDEVCYVHDNTGFADCGLVISGGTKSMDGITVDPTFTVTDPLQRKAAPREWFAETPEEQP